MSGVDKRILARGPDSTNADLSRLAPLIRGGGYVPFCDHHASPTQGFPISLAIVFARATMGETRGHDGLRGNSV